MKRYKFLSQENVYEALNKLRAAFLAARDGNEVEEIIKGILTHDERMKIGRRIQISQMLKNDLTYKEIKDVLKVGVPTTTLVDTKMHENPKCYELVEAREEKVELDFKRRAFTKSGNPKAVFKATVYTGFKRKDVQR